MAKLLGDILANIDDLLINPDVNPGRFDRFVDNSIHDLFAQLRATTPLHYTAKSEFGAYWSVLLHKDIVEIEALPQLYSSDSSHGGISIIDAEFAGTDEAETEANRLETFIAMDPPEHTQRRRVVAPAFTPSEIVRLSETIRSHTASIIAGLPRDAVFNWTKDVSIRLTTDMLATLFDFPWDERDQLNYWSDVITDLDMIKNRNGERQMIIFGMAMRMFALWQERLAAPPAADLLSRMIHSDALNTMDQKEFIGNMSLLIVGGNDTTRNTMSGFVDAINRWPDEWDKIAANRALLPNAVSEIIRWQSPVLHMRRTVTQDHEFRGQQLRAGDRMVMWYASANRDEAMFDDGARFIADRANARRHIGFGYGVHRCVGARLAELQIQLLMEALLDAGVRPELAGPITREPNNFVSQISTVPVRLVKQ